MGRKFLQVGVTFPAMRLTAQGNRFREEGKRGEREGGIKAIELQEHLLESAENM